MDISLWILESVRFTLVCLVMGYAAFSDYKTGEVSNKLWLSGAIGFSLSLLELLIYSNTALQIYLISIMIISIAFGFATFLIGGGGADAKAIMFLGVSAPLVPFWSIFYPLPLSLLALLFASALALPFMIFKKSNIPIWKRKLRFLPFMFVGTLVWVIL